MAIDLDLFSGNNYRSTIQRYCNNLGRKISDINERRTILRFPMDSGTTQTLFVIRSQTVDQTVISTALTALQVVTPDTLIQALNRSP